MVCPKYLSLFGALAYSSTALAFQTPTPPPELAASALTWPTGVPTTGVSTSVVGDFTGDSTPDVWMITGTHLAFFMDPSYMDLSFSLSKSATTIARLPKTTPSGKDILVCADASGLTFIEFNVQAGSAMFTSSLPAYPAWINARSMTCADLNLDGIQDLLAVSANGNKLMRLMGDSQGGYAAVADINAPTGTYEALAFQYIVGQVPRLAALAPNWVTVIEQNGTRTSLTATGGTPGHLAKISDRLPDQTDIPDCVVWLADAGLGTQKIHVLEQVAPQSPYTLPIPPVGAMYSGDVDGDGFMDLGFLNEDYQEVHVLRNARSVTSLNVARFSASSPVESTTIAQFPELPAARPTPVLEDLNFDRKADLFVPYTPGYLLAILRDSPFSPPAPPGPPNTEWNLVDSEHPCFHRSDFYTDAFLECFYPTNPPNTPPYENGRLMFELRDPWSWTSQDYIQLRMYRQAAGFPTVETQAIAHHRYELATTMYRVATQGGTFRLPVDIPTEDVIFGDKYYLVVSLVRGATDTVETEYVAGFSSDIHQSGPLHIGSIDYLVALPGAWEASIPWTIGNVGPNCSIPQKLETGGMVPLLRLPRYTGNQPPTYDPPTDPPPVIPPDN